MTDGLAALIAFGLFAVPIMCARRAVTHRIRSSETEKRMVHAITHAGMFFWGYCLNVPSHAHIHNAGTAAFLTQSLTVMDHACDREIDLLLFATEIVGLFSVAAAAPFHPRAFQCAAYVVYGISHVFARVETDSETEPDSDSDSETDLKEKLLEV